jgi:hypothetical protein
MNLKKQILEALGLEKEEVQMGWQAKTEDGTILVSTAEELENGVDISVLTEDGTTIPLPAGTYKLDTGVSFRVEEEGVVAELIESETEEKEEVEAGEDRGEDDDEVAVDDWEGMEKRIKNLEDAVADLKADKVEASEELEEVSDKPKSIKTTEVKEFSAEEEIEKLKEENEKLKTELAESPADAPINTNKFSSERPTPTKQDFRRMNKQEKFLYELYK